MRLTVEKLFSFAHKLVESRQRDVRLLAAYLTGSLVDGNPFVGGAADVDVVFIYNAAPEVEREALPLFGAVHLDVHNHDRAVYEPPRRFRTEPWLGPALFIARPLYDPQHFLDFVQAAARSRFRDADVAYRRAQSLLESARRRWFDLPTEPMPSNVALFLEAVYEAANIPATLHGRALSRRRLLADFPQAERWIGADGLTALLYRTLVRNVEIAEGIGEYFPLWEAALSAAQTPPEIAPLRIPYFRNAMQAYVSAGAPLQAVYPMVYTWTVAVLEGASSDENWQKFIAASGIEDLASGRAALDSFLDASEDALEAWARTHGAL